MLPNTVGATSIPLTATGSTVNIQLILNVTPSGTPGVLDVTGLSGRVDGQTVTFLPTSSPGAITDTAVVNGWYILYDDLYYINSPHVDLYGLGFRLADGTLSNLYYSGGNLYAQLGANPPFIESVAVSTAPEPTGLLLLGTSVLVALGMTLLHKRLA